MTIVYGYPSPELQHLVRRGQAHLGGCCVTGNDPDWHCAACGHEWISKPKDLEELL